MPKVQRRARKPGKKRLTPTKKKLSKMELKYIPWNSVELEDLNPLLQRQFVVGEDIMLARVLMKKGCIVPRHSHHNEQLTYILEGALKFWIDGKEIVVNAGEVLTILRTCRTRLKRWLTQLIWTSSIHHGKTGSAKPINTFAAANNTSFLYSCSECNNTPAQSLRRDPRNCVASVAEPYAKAPAEISVARTAAICWK